MAGLGFGQPGSHDKPNIATQGLFLISFQWLHLSMFSLALVPSLSLPPVFSLVFDISLLVLLLSPFAFRLSV